MEEQVSRPAAVATTGALMSGAQGRIGHEPPPSAAGDRRPESLTDDWLELEGGAQAEADNAGPRREQVRQTADQLWRGDDHESSVLETLLPSENPVSPLERFWDETQRHERIALMMQQSLAAPRAPEPHAVPEEPSGALKTEPQEPGGLPTQGPDETNLTAGGDSPRRRSTWPGPSRALGVDAQLAVDEEVDDDGGGGRMLEAIRIAAQIQ